MTSPLGYERVVGRLREQALRFAAHNTTAGCASVRINRTVAATGDPLAGPGVAPGVFLGGYEQSIEMTVTGVAAQWWSVTNLHPRGEVYFAATPAVQAIDFIQPAASDMRLTGPGYVGGRITGDCAYKLGFSAPHLFGRYAYLCKREDATGVLFVRSFPLAAEGRYLEEVAHRPGYTGAAGFIYNDAGDLGAFGEAECMGAAVGGSQGPAGCRDRVTLWVYTGTRSQLAPVMRALMGIEI